MAVALKLKRATLYCRASTDRRPEFNRTLSERTRQ